MQHKLKRKAVDEDTPEFTEVGYDEPMEHIEEDIDVIAQREVESHRRAAVTAWSKRSA